MVKKNINTYFYAVGRRKSAVATVKLFPKKGDSLINDQAVNKYFPTDLLQLVFQKPLKVSNLFDKYHFLAKIIGGGKNGQADALSLALARALVKSDVNLKPELRTAGLVTVDSRVRQRRMVGTGGKARRQKQSPKR
ncbi:MAG: 30S ribosomal protein S9 [Candidatus Shapirobacteria bacterium]